LAVLWDCFSQQVAAGTPYAPLWESRVLQRIGGGFDFDFGFTYT
jgi:hypothetical protein